MDIISLYNAVNDYFKERTTYVYLSLDSFSRQYRGNTYLYVRAKVHNRVCFLHFEWIDEKIFGGYIRLVKVI